MTEYIDPNSHILWLDIETTGLDLIDDQILEVGMILTDNKLDEISHISSIYPTVAARTRLRDIERYIKNGDAGENEEFVYKMHKSNGLFDEILSSDVKGSLEIEHGFMRWAEELRIKHGTLPMAGNSVHFDRGFLQEVNSRVIELFTYRNIDVSTIKETLRRFDNSQFEGITARLSGPKSHRVIDDLRHSIAEYRAYLNFLGLL